MSGRTLLPGGPRKASQRHRRTAAPAPVAIAPSWRPGDRVRWKDYTGTFLRETGDGEAEVLIGARTYRVAAGELRPA
jgi:hypothetical protein